MSFTSAAAQDGTAAAPAERWVDVYLSAAGRAISTCGDYLAATALVLALQDRGAGSYAVAAVLLAAAVPPVVLAPLTGRLVDRVDSRVLLVVTGLAQAAVCAALAYTGSVVLVVALAALLAAGLAVTQPTLSALVPAMVTRPNLAKAAAVGQTASSLGGLLAPVLGGLLFGAFGLRVPLLADAVSFLAIAALGLLLRTRRNAPAAGALAGGATTGAAGPTPAPAWRLRGDALLFPLIALSAAVVALVSAINVVDVFFMRGELHASTTAYGLIGALWMAAAMAGAWALAKVRLADAGTAAAMFGSLTALCLVAAGIAVVPTLGWLIPVMLVGGALNGVLNTAVGVLTGSRVPAAARGRAFALLGAVVNGASAAGLLLGGVLLGVLPVRTTLAVAGLGGFVVALVFAGPTLRAIARERASARHVPAGDVTRAAEPAGVS